MLYRERVRDEEVGETETRDKEGRETAGIQSEDGTSDRAGIAQGLVNSYDKGQKDGKDSVSFQSASSGEDSEIAGTDANVSTRGMTAREDCETVEDSRFINQYQALYGRQSRSRMFGKLFPGDLGLRPGEGKLRDVSSKPQGDELKENRELDQRGVWEQQKGSGSGGKQRDGVAEHTKLSLATSGGGVEKQDREWKVRESEASRLFPVLTHTDSQGKAEMVDVGDKPSSLREARARGKIILGPTAFALVRDNGMKKGDVLTVAQLAGILAAKRTSDLIPLCHNIPISKVDVKCRLNKDDFSVEVEGVVRTRGVTGVEMEALTAVAIATLTVYDMCKAVTRDMVITDVRLVSKTGGVRGDYFAKG
jgi:molybdenum cofactor biosynthesis protein MoaC